MVVKTGDDRKLIKYSDGFNCLILKSSENSFWRLFIWGFFEKVVETHFVRDE